ncbi:Uncharacterised protein [Mycobacterium tuberculosis]|nr:Uncharacterised protein [Mycobacterium tuberculosis]
MPSLAVRAVGGARGIRLVGMHGNKVDRGAMKPQIQLTSARFTEAGFYHECRFQVRRRRHQPDVVGFDGGLEPLCVWLVAEHRNERGRVDHHQAGNPRSS